MSQPNYSIKLVTFAQVAQATRINVIFQDQLLQLATAKQGMIKHLAMANKHGVCAALTTKFVEAAMQGRLSTFNQSSLATELSSVLLSQFGSSFFALQSGGTKGNFVIASSHLNPSLHSVNMPRTGLAFEIALDVAIAKAATALANTVVLEMHGDKGHVIGLKVVRGGISSFFDANAGLYQFPIVGKLKDFCLAAYAVADYQFTQFKVVSFGKMPSS